MNLVLTPAVNSGITITPEAERQKADALELAKTITGVSSAAEQRDAIAAASICKGLVKGMETSREEVKRPVLDLGRDIDGKAKAYSAALNAEVLRIESMASEWQRKENARVDALRREEETRQQKEREAAQGDQDREKRFMAEKGDQYREERLADLQRIADAPDDESREEARRIADQNAEARDEEVRNLQTACREAEEQRMNDARERQQTMLAVSTPTKAAGATVRKQYDYRVTDLKEFASVHPEFVSIEPKRALILAAICNGRQLTGLDVFEVVKVHARV